MEGAGGGGGGGGGGGHGRDMTTDIWSCLNYHSHTVLK